MIRIFIFFSLFFFNHQLFSQSASNDLKDLLIGDWYYFENKEDNCGFEQVIMRLYSMTHFTWLLITVINILFIYIILLTMT
jgi:hypothetical protein